MLQDDKVILRPWQEGDIEVLSQLRNDIALQESLMALPKPSTLERVREWLESKSSDDGAVFFVIEDLSSGTVAGFVQVVSIDAVQGIGTLGIGLLPQFQGKGLAGPSIALLERYLSQVFRLRKLILQVLSDNKAAIRVYEKSGFKRAGKWKKHHFASGKLRDVLLFEKFLKS